jgi:hypothetical protein
MLMGPVTYVGEMKKSNSSYRSQRLRLASSIARCLGIFAFS